MNQSTQVIVNASAHRIPLPDRMIHTVVTSPPYYSLRKYAGEQQVDWPRMFYQAMPSQGWRPSVEVEPMRCALGLEPTPEAYIGHLVLVFREVRRVLREDGVAWVVMGDSYNADSPVRSRSSEAFETTFTGGKISQGTRRSASGSALQQGDLMLIPHRLALALQADGWLVRNDVVWHKVAPMPQSVSGWRWERCRVKVKAGRYDSDQKQAINPTGAGFNQRWDGEEGWSATWTDCPGCPRCSEHGGYVLRRGSWRHTRAHETVLMLAQGMNYYADQERVREENSENTHGGFSPNVHKMWAIGLTGNATTLGIYGAHSGRNPRSVLTPRPESYSGAHYAVYPRTLIYPLLRATAPTRVCHVCGAPWCPVVEREGTWEARKAAGADSGSLVIGHNAEHGAGMSHDLDCTVNLLGHRPTCSHDAEPVPGWVLDPFVGSGTTLEVCAELGVNAAGLDISPEYLDEHAKPRIGLTPAGALDTLPLFEGMDL